MHRASLLTINQHFHLLQNFQESAIQGEWRSWACSIQLWWQDATANERLKGHCRDSDPEMNGELSGKWSGYSREMVGKIIQKRSERWSGNKREIVEKRIEKWAWSCPEMIETWAGSWLQNDREMGGALQKKLERWLRNYQPDEIEKVRENHHRENDRKMSGELSAVNT